MTTENVSLFNLGEVLARFDHRYRFYLHDPNEVRFIERGDIDIHAVELREGLADGPLSYVMSFSAGDMVFGFEMFRGQYDYKMMATLSAEGVMRKTSLTEIEELIKNDPEARSLFVEQLEKWIVKGYSQFEESFEPDVDVLLSGGEDIEIEENVSISTVHTSNSNGQFNVQWIDVLDGEVHVFGNKEFKLTKDSYPFPLHAGMWLYSTSKVKLSMISTEQLLCREDWRKIFWRYQENFFEMFVDACRYRKKAELRSIAEKAAFEEKVMDDSLSNLGAVLEDVSIIQTVDAGSNLFKACQIIGKDLGINFVMPDKTLGSSNIAAEIASICDASHVRYRKVSLESGWWKNDNGPLIAFWGEELLPIVLLRRGSFYEMVDPETGIIRKVNAKLASNIVSDGYMLYSSFPEEEVSGKGVLKFAFKGLSREIWTMIWSGVVAMVFALFFPFATSLIFDKIIPFFELGLLWQVSIGLFLAAVSYGIFSFVQSYAALRMETIINNRLQVGMWDKLLDLPVSFFRKYTIGDLLQRVFAISNIRQLISGSFIRAVLGGVFSLLYFVTMIYYSWQLAIAGVLMLFFVAVVVTVCMIYSVKINTDVLQRKGKLNGFIIQVVSAIEKFRSTGTENIAFAHWGRAFSKIKRKELLANNISSFNVVLRAIYPALSLFLIYGVFFGFILDSGNKLSLGDFLAFSAAWGGFSGAIFGMLIITIPVIGGIIPQWKRVSSILEADPEEGEIKSSPGNLRGVIEVSNTYFHYTEDGPAILKGVSFNAKPGEFIGIVGPSGGGKSTLIRLLLGFETPQKGVISYDDKDLSEVDVRAVRRQLGVVLQDSDILAGSIQENLICGGIYTQEQVLRAIKLAGFDEDLKQFPMGLFTFLTDGGSSLSGGQKQRLLIARALIGDPKILILDEATSALDNKTQEQVSINIQKLNVTRIVIAHRLSTVRKADRIYVLDEGKIVDSGTFEELARREGYFARMLKRQQV